MLNNLLFRQTRKEGNLLVEEFAD